MSTAWTLKHLAGAEPTNSFADWGIEQVKLRRQSHGPDIMTFIESDVAYDADPTFDESELCEVYRDGVGYFLGRVVKIHRHGGPDREQIEYELHGPWWYFDNHIFQQTAKSYNNGTQSLENIYWDHLVLGLAIGNTRQNMKATLEEIVDYSITEGAPIQRDSTDWPTTEFPYTEAKTITAAEAIKQVLRWTPDTITWFDYTTTDAGYLKPTFYVKRRADLTSKSVSAAPETTHDDVREITITPRNDLKRTGVVLKYSQVNNVDSNAWHQITTDQAPDTGETGREFDTFHATIDLPGFSVQYVYQQLTCQAISPSDANWWKTHEAWLNDSDVTSITISNVTRSSGTYDREVIDGQIASWMSVGSENETIRADITVINADGSKVKKSVAAQVMATNATTGTYRDTSSFTPGETAPVGLAQVLLDAWNTTQYEGSLTIHEDEVSMKAKPGDVLNITGGRSAWTTMNAVVWATEENIDDGVTQIRIGPVATLGPADLIELARANRTPRWSFNVSTLRTQGTLGSSGQVEIGKDLAKDNAGSGNERYERMIMKKGSQAEVDMNIDDAFGAGMGRKIKFREVSVCTTDSDGNPVTKRMIVLCSEVF